MVLVGVSALGPGLLVVWRRRWSAAERLVCALGAGWIVTYVWGFFLYLVNAGAWAYWGTSGVFAILFLCQLGRVRQLFHSRAVRWMALAYGALVLWGFLLLCLVRNFSGGFWTGDWVEQFQRMLVFLRLIPVHFEFQGIMYLPARTPMLHVLAAFYCRQVGMEPDGRVSFAMFSVVFLLLNAWMVFPCCLLLSRFGAGNRRRMGVYAVAVLALLLMLNPCVAENLTWTWTKFCSAGYALAAIAMYLRALSVPGRRGGSYLVAAGLLLTAAALVHLTAAAVVIFVGTHFLVSVLRGKRWRVVDVAVLVASCAALASVWFAWSLSEFGARMTFRSYADAPVGSVEQHTPTLARWGHNLLYTLVPHGPAYERLAPWYGTDSSLAKLRDYWFELDQSCLLVMLGSLGGVVLVILLLRRWRGNREGWFWAGLVAASVVLGCLSTSRVEEFGAGMLSLPVVLAGITFLAATIGDAPRVLRVAVLIGCAVDLVLGIGLHFWLQHAVFAFRHEGGMWVLHHEGFNDAAAANFYAKEYLHLRFWGDAIGAGGPVVMGVVAVVGVVAWVGLGFLVLRGRRGATASRLAGY